MQQAQALMDLRPVAPLIEVCFTVVSHPGWRAGFTWSGIVLSPGYCIGYGRWSE